jgi:hypothetical protein
MNERIRELAEQAKCHADYYAMLSDGIEQEIFTTKFAQLIVRECSKVIRHGGYRRGAFGNEDLRPSEIATMIEEHFEVEE